MDSIDKQLEIQPKYVIYCKKCVISNQRPRITFDENGICRPCNWAEEKKGIDWAGRQQKLIDLCGKYRRHDGRYDVIVPCSGGKDSAMVAHKLKHIYNMHPLCITYAPFLYTETGWANFQNLIKSGFTVIQNWPNSHLHRILSRIAFEAVGDNFQPFPYGQVAFPFHMALKHNIKLVFYGENQDIEYGGNPKTKNMPGMPIEDFAERFFKGALIKDLILWGEDRGLISGRDYLESDLMFYQSPPIDEIKSADIQFHWMGFYQPWHPLENVDYVIKNTGFQRDPQRSTGTYTNYASLDDKLDGLHYYMAYIKFGIGRATADVCSAIRDGIMSRDEAIDIVSKYDGEFPNRYLDEVLEYLSLNMTELHSIIDMYRPPHLWKKVNGEWKLKETI